jgi:hypothetical protein
MALKFPSYPVPLQYQYKPMALETFAQPLAQLQHRFDTAKTALDDLDLGINSLTPDTGRSKEIQQELLTKQQELVDELYKTKDSSYIAREIKKLNKVFNENPEIKGLRNQYATYKDLDGQYRERQEKDPETYPDFWRKEDMTSRSYEYTQAGGLNYNWGTGDYNAFDGATPVPYLEAEIMKQAANMANTAAVQGGQLPDEAFVGIDGSLKDRIRAVDFKNVDQMTGEIAAVLRSSNRYNDFLQYEGKVKFNNLMAGTDPDEKELESNKIIGAHREKITDYIAELTKKAEDQNLNLEELPAYQQAMEYLGEIDENRSTKTPEELARILFTKDHRDTRISDASYDAADIENFQKITDKFIGGGDGGSGSKGIKPEEVSQYQINVQGSTFVPQNADGTTGTPTYADYSTALEGLKAGEIHGTVNEDGSITPTAYPQLGNWIMNHPSNIQNSYKNNIDVLGANEVYNRKAETIYSVGHIAENTASRARNYENWVESSTNVVADLKEKANSGNITNDERNKLKELTENIPAVKLLYSNEFTKINFDLRNAAKSDERLRKILENNSGEFNANTYEQISQSYQNTLDDLVKAATVDARLTGELSELELGYNPTAPGAAQSEPMVGIDLLQRQEVDLVEEGLRNRVRPFDEEGNLLRKTEIEAQITELQKQQDLIKNIAPSVFREWNNALNIKESSRTIALYNNDAVNKFTGDKVNELIDTITEGGIGGLDQVIYDPTKASYETVGTIKVDELDWSAYEGQTPTIEVVLDEAEGGQTVILGYNRDESKATPRADMGSFLYDKLGIVEDGIKKADWLASGEVDIKKEYEKYNPKKLFVAVKNTNFGNTITDNAATNYIRLAEQELTKAAQAMQMGEQGRQLYEEKNYTFGTLLSSMSAISLVSDGKMQKDYMELSAGLTAAQRNGDFAALTEQPTAVWKELEDGNKEGYKIVYDLNDDNRIIANIIKETVDKNYNVIKELTRFEHEVILNDYTPTKLRQLDLIYGTGSNPIYSNIKQGTWVPMHTTLKSSLPANAVGTVKQ